MLTKVAEVTPTSVAVGNLTRASNKNKREIKEIETKKQT